MTKNALARVLEECKLHGYTPDCFELFYGKHTVFYSGSYYGYVYETDDPDSDQNESEYIYPSFEDLLDSPIKELGKTWREVLIETPADKIFIGW